MHTQLKPISPFSTAPTLSNQSAWGDNAAEACLEPLLEPPAAGQVAAQRKVFKLGRGLIRVACDFAASG
ncbi:hypothetical protein [Pyrobaculum sp.]|uniref:hypothetical protein n=1 Tax=Pyrobaculum sp. TaxID=2004705 RepID=UPI00318205E5